MKNANNIDKILDNAFEEMLSAAAFEACREEAAKIPVPADKVDFSPEHKQKMSKLFAQYKRREMLKKLAKASKYAACILLAFVTVSAVTVFSVDAWRTRVLNYIYDPSAPGTEFHFDDKGGKYFSEDGLILNYVPSGFHLEKDFSDNVNIRLHFEDDANNYFTIVTHGLDSNIGLDTEDSVVEEIIINGNKAIRVTNDRDNLIMWYDDNFAYVTNGNISHKELEKIVKNVEYK
ncbi:MAG: DUF4367 domain-containing protein [Clostridia bacterium]|nr:DUF4367 domain-containing protein [Clostridia bacterium]